jgi:predicted deacylase
MTPERQPHFKSYNYTGMQAGPRLIVCGAVHGNETCGTQAIMRVLDELDSGALRIAAGSVTFVPVANPLAYARGERAGERNLNRRLFPSRQPQDFEDHVANWLCPLLAQHEVLLDLHSFSANSEPFAMLGPLDNKETLEPFAHSAKERALARRLGVRRFVDGWMATYAKGVTRRAASEQELQDALRYGVGTTEYMRRMGGYAITLECGQHDAPNAPQVAYRAIMNTLSFLELIDAPRPVPVEPGQIEALSMAEVTDKADAEDRFAREWSSFDRVAKGDTIGVRSDGRAVLASFDGMVLFPDAGAAAGSEWFYLARPNPDFDAGPRD